MVRCGISAASWLVLPALIAALPQSFDGASSGSVKTPTVTLQDHDRNGIPDMYQHQTVTLPDMNSNGVPDLYEHKDASEQSRDQGSNQEDGRDQKGDDTASDSRSDSSAKPKLSAQDRSDAPRKTDGSKSRRTSGGRASSPQRNRSDSDADSGRGDSSRDRIEEGPEPDSSGSGSQSSNTHGIIGSKHYTDGELEELGQQLPRNMRHQFATWRKQLEGSILEEIHTLKKMKREHHAKKGKHRKSLRKSVKSRRWS